MSPGDLRVIRNERAWKVPVNKDPSWFAKEPRPFTQDGALLPMGTPMILLTRTHFYNEDSREKFFVWEVLTPRNGITWTRESSLELMTREP